MFPRFATVVLLLSIVRVSADTFVVTNASDSGPGSLRHAISDANAHANSADADRIHFNIPGAGVQTIVLASGLPDITESVFVDGWSQPGFQSKPLIELTGAPGLEVDGLRLMSDFITVRGLIVNRFRTGIFIGPYSRSSIQGCYVGTDQTGAVPAPNGTGITISGGSRNLIGGSAPGAGNLISGNTNGSGIHITKQTFSGSPDITPAFNIVQGNFIGTDVTGMAAVPNLIGISIPVTSNFGGFAQRGHQIGGTIRSARNVISGNRFDGIRIEGATEIRIQGNLIGTAADGVSPLGNQAAGLELVAVAGCIVGAETGPNLDAANKIAFNGGENNSFAGNGILFLSTSSPILNRVSANSIHDNVKLGIDLRGDGVTPNDPDNLNVGQQNFPVITDAFEVNGQIIIYGSLSSIASTNFTLEFFANPAADDSGFGEGQVFLGQANVTTDSSGNAAFNVTFPLPPNVSVVTATAIGPSSRTSEFSAAVNISSSAPTAPPTGPTAVALPTRADQLLNLSTRLRVEPGDHNLIAGFIVNGSEPKKVIVRALGPSLSQFNVPEILADPNITLTRSDVLFNDPRAFVGSNDNWKSDQQAEIEGSGLAPSNALEAALIRTLDPGFYTAVMRGNGSGAGVGLIEVYDLSANSNSFPANISTRGFVGTGDNVMIAGVIIGGNGKGGATVVIRGIGPSLSSFDIPDAISDPLVDLYDANGTFLAESNDWKTTSGADLVRATGLEPDNDREAALYISLAPGAYTTVLRGVNSSVGVALVEVYDVGH